MRSIRLLAIAMVTLIGACGGGGDEADGSGGGPPDIVRPTPGPTNSVMPVFARPFANEFQVLNYFDHDVPTAPNTTNGYQLN